MIVHRQLNVCKAKKKITQKACSQLSQKVLKGITKSINKKEVNHIALASKFVQRSSSKFNGFEFLTAMLVSSIDSEHATLEKISDVFRSQHNVRIRAQSIMERLNDESAVIFLKGIFEKMLGNQFDSFTQEISPKLLSGFSKILIQDSSVCDLNQQLALAFKGSGGRASKASLKLDVIYDFKAKRFEHIKLTDRSEADQKLGWKILDHLTPGTLVIRDLGYLRIDCIQKIVEVGGFFLSRLKNNITVYLNEANSEQLDLAKYLHENFRKVNVVDVKVYITAEKVCARLVAYRVPEEISMQRRRAAHAKAKKEGRTLSQKSLTLLDFTLFITNVLVEIWPAKVVGTIYRIRWQIELMFKNWKSRLKIDCLYGINEFRIRCLIYTKAILVLIINEIYKLLDYVGHCTNKVVSIHKVYSWLKCASRVVRIISGKLSWWEERHLGDLIVTCMAHQSRKRKTSLQAIHEEDLYYLEAS
jgi:hypothetical protein